MIKADEVDDIFCILEASYRKKNSKGIMICLELLNSQSLCPLSYLKTVPENYIRVIESIASFKQILEESNYYDEEAATKDSGTNKTLASNLLVRIANASKSDYHDDQSHGNKPFGESLSQNERRFEKPSSLKTCLFQLSESNDIDRVVFLLDDILNSYLNKIDHLSNSGFLKVVKKLVFRYSNGDFGFENNDNTRYCVFQNRILKSLLVLFGYNPTLVYEVEPEFLNALAQIIEECCMYIIENISNSDRRYEHEYRLAFELSLELFELLLTNHSKDNIAEVTSSIKNIIQRVNIYFSQHAEEECDAEELSAFYEELNAYYKDIRKLLMKTEALTNIYDSKSKTRVALGEFNRENITSKLSIKETTL